MANCNSMLLVLVFISCCESCPPWTRANSDGKCECGNDLTGVIHCNSETLQVSVLYCYCMTYSTLTNETLVGHCTAMCTYQDTTACKTSNLIQYASGPENINNETCGILNRDGQLCGNCLEGYGPPAYSYSVTCVQCNATHFKPNLLKYVTFALVPLTVFYGMVIVFKIRATSGPMVAFVLICQLLSTPTLIRAVSISYAKPSLAVKMFIAFCGVWNVDIFRSLYAPFCIHPNMTTLQVLALDYLVGVYPLLLIVLTYFAVMLHDRYPLIIKLWAPVNRLCMCIRKQWDIRGSLIQAFATFLVLSYIKILNVSFDLLTPVSLFNMDGEMVNQTYLYSVGNVAYFGKEHLPYGVLAATMLTVFNILPVILLSLYPCSCFQKCLNCCHLNSPALRVFMDTFQGCYRHQPRDCRYFAALYLFMRILQPLLLIAIKNALFLPVMGFCLILLAHAVTFFKPYKHGVQNTVDTMFLLLLGTSYLSTVALEYEFVFDPQLPVSIPYGILLSIPCIILVLYLAIFVAMKLLPRSTLTMFKSCIALLFKKRRQLCNMEEPFLHQLQNESS